MTTLQPAEDRPRLAWPAGAIAVARAAMFAVAVGVFLAAPPSLPWVLALVALTNVVVRVARAWMSGSRPPMPLLLIDGLTVALVVLYAWTTGAG